MTDLTFDTALRIAKLRCNFVQNDRYVPLARQFAMLSERRLADLASNTTSEVHGLALTGQSGAGKTAAIANLLSCERDRLKTRGYGDSTIISLRVPSPATLKFVGQALLKALGYQISTERTAPYIWDMVRHHLAERRVLFVHLDEAQHLASRGTKHELNSVASMLKSLMTDDTWPVGIVLSGTNELEDILNHDPQLARRMKSHHFPSLSPVAHGEDALDLMDCYCEKAGLSPDDALQQIGQGERLVHAAANQFGLVIELILAAIEEALYEGTDTLTVAHFAQAYRNRSSCDDLFNPFIATDYTRIDPRQVFTRDLH